MAILVTAKNISSFTILNGGVEMKKSIFLSEKGPYYFILPFDAADCVYVMQAEHFHEHFKFAETEDPRQFVNIIQIA